MGKVLYNIYIYLNSREEKHMEEKRLLSKDEVYFLVFFSNSFIGSIILSGRYHFDSIRSFFIFAGEDPFPFTLFFLVFFCCLYYFFKILIKKHSLRNFIKSNDV